jgi:hypothetical protein
LLNGRVAVSICDLLYFGPLLQNLWAELCLAPGANVSDLSPVWITLLAEVFEEDVDFEIFRQYFVFIFADIFWT